jgi:hypothetical protein
VLNLQNNGVTLKGLRALADSPPGGRLLYLGLWFNPALSWQVTAIRALFPAAVVSFEPDVLV